MSESSTLPANYDAQLASTLQIQVPLTLTPSLTNPDSNPDSLTLTLDGREPDPRGEDVG